VSGPTCEQPRSNPAVVVPAAYAHVRRRAADTAPDHAAPKRTLLPEDVATPGRPAQSGRDGRGRRPANLHRLQRAGPSSRVRHGWTRPPSRPGVIRRTFRRVLNVNGQITGGDRGGLVRGPVDQWVDELNDLVVGHGFDTVMFWAEQPGQLARFAEEVVPAVRSQGRRRARPARLTPLRPDRAQRRSPRSRPPTRFAAGSPELQQTLVPRRRAVSAIGTAARPFQPPGQRGAPRVVLPAAWSPRASGPDLTGVGYLADDSAGMPQLPKVIVAQTLAGSHPGWRQGGEGGSAGPGDRPGVTRRLGAQNVLRRIPGTFTRPPNVVHANRGRWDAKEAHDRAETLSECGV
jgi:hypothetical protein